MKVQNMSWFETTIVDKCNFVDKNFDFAMIAIMSNIDKYLLSDTRAISIQLFKNFIKSMNTYSDSLTLTQNLSLKTRVWCVISLSRDFNTTYHHQMIERKCKSSHLFYMGSDIGVGEL